MSKDLTKKASLGLTIGGFEINPPATNPEFQTLPGILGFVADILNWFIAFSGLVAVIMIVYGGFLLITAAGDPDKISNGGKAITAAVVGMIIVFLAKTIVMFVLENFLP